MQWKIGQLLWIETDQGLGPARIIEDGEVFKVHILSSGEERGYTKRNPPFKRVQLFAGQKVKVKDFPHDIVIKNVEFKDDFYTFEYSGKTFSETDISELLNSIGVLDLLRQKKATSPKAFTLRKEAWDLLQLRDVHPLKGAIGCRVQILPHQLWVVDQVLKMPKARALLADEVGLGKTIEAGLIFSALHAQKKLKKVLILVPAALKVQWLMESFRRFNVRFRLDHEDLIEEDEFRDFVITSLEELDKNAAAFDLLIVDEAHRLVHDSEKSEQLAQLVREAKHVLFLSATPKVHGEEEYLKMLGILGATTESNISPLVFQSRRKDLELPSYRHLEAALVEDKEKWLSEFLAQKLLEEKKVFIICSKAEDVLALNAKLRAKVGEYFALFHEEMDLVERDRQAAYFADPEGARFLLSSEIGGEGRNFQFCHDMVLFDLPRDPLVVEQRIGRLDRLGQTKRVNVWCPVSEADADNFEMLRDKYKVFLEPWSGSGLADEVDLSDSKKNLSKIGIPYDASYAAELVSSVEKLSDINIKDFLDQLYDLFGVEVEDFDTHGNWRVFTSSLMFVDYFPGLGESGERVLSFDRAQALAREDLSFFSIDHPDFVESVEFLLNSDQGKFSLAVLAGQEMQDLQLIGLFKERNSFQSNFKIWSTKRRRAVKSEKALEFHDSPEAMSLFESVQSLVPDVFENFVKAYPDWDIDALLAQFLK